MELDAFVDLIEKPTWKTLLVSTVKSEDLDPWSIDVTLLASKYSEKLNSMKYKDFRIPANAVLASAILVRFKSDSWQLVPVDPPELPGESEDYSDFCMFEMPEVEPTQRLTTRRVTLDELITAIEQVMVKTKRKVATRQVPKEVLEFTLGEREEFKKGIENIYAKLIKKADSENLVLFSDVLEEKSKPEVVRVLLSVLHLACENKVSVWQEKQFGEIFILIKEEEQ
ncbi:hypothetical protein K8R43_06570 [archaeon]|nr:hypothetical protein [archaeon]